MKNIIFVTSSAPYGKGEAFVTSEINLLYEKGYNVTVLPTIHRAKKSFNYIHDQIDEINLPLFSLMGIFHFFLFFLKCPRLSLKILFLISNTSLKNAIKNYCVLLKAVRVAFILKKRKIEFIYCHWASTPATVSMIVSAIIDVPWGFTAHRGDIVVNNLLKEKVNSASFIRFISEKSKNLAEHSIDSKIEKSNVIYMGTQILDKNLAKEYSKPVSSFIIMADFYKVKGHQYLVEALKILVKKGYEPNVIFFGDGPEKNKIKKSLCSFRLDKFCTFMGHISHKNLIQFLTKENKSACILPSVDLGGGLHEGIPVALMEAMSFGLPVVSTNTGGIPELLSDNCGIIVDQKSPEALALAMENLMKDKDLCNKLSVLGYRRIKDKFDLQICFDQVEALIIKNSKTY